MRHVHSLVDVGVLVAHLQLEAVRDVLGPPPGQGAGHERHTREAQRAQHEARTGNERGQVRAAAAGETQRATELPRFQNGEKNIVVREPNSFVA